MVRNRLMDVLMKILLPVCFIALKLTGCFIDFMLGFANSSVQEDIDLDTFQVRDSRAVNHGSNRIERILSSVDYGYHESYETVVEDLLTLNGTSAVEDFLVSKGSYTLKNLLGKKTIESFKFRTCVKPKLSENRLGETEIVYESLTTQDLLPKRP